MIDMSRAEIDAIIHIVLSEYSVTSDGEGWHLNNIEGLAPEFSVTRVSKDEVYAHCVKHVIKTRYSAVRNLAQQTCAKG